MSTFWQHSFHCIWLNVLDGGVCCSPVCLVWWSVAWQFQRHSTWSTMTRPVLRPTSPPAMETTRTRPAAHCIHFPLRLLLMSNNILTGNAVCLIGSYHLQFWDFIFFNWCCISLSEPFWGPFYRHFIILVWKSVVPMRVRINLLKTSKKVKWYKLDPLWCDVQKNRFQNRID